MPHVFVDTVGWIALANTRDSLHSVAREIFERLWETDTAFITSEFVLIELGNALSSHDFRLRTAEFIQTLKHSSSIEVVPSSSGLFDRGQKLYGERRDKAWGLVDCTSFVIMTERNITKVFTEDHHFEQAGFTKLL